MRNKQTAFKDTRRAGPASPASVAARAALFALAGAATWAAVRRGGGPGGAIKLVTGAFGFKPCAACDRRAAVLDRWFDVRRYRVK